MGAAESSIQNKVQLAASRLGHRLFRNNVGKVRDDKGRWHSFGWPKGSPDLTGWQRVTITEDMVGKTVAVALGVEIKTATGRVRPDQERFLEMMKEQGCICGVARSVEDLLAILGEVDDA